jgi:hypothetical protein
LKNLTRREPRNKRPPPYAREFQEARETGRYCNPWLFAGRDAFARAAGRGPGRMVLPDGVEPADLDWSVVTGLDVVVTWPRASVPEIDALGAALVRAGARSVNVLPDLHGDVLAGRVDCLRPPRRYVPPRRAAA